MKEQKIARAYGQSLIDLGKEAKLDLSAEMINFNEIINSSNELETLLFLDVFTAEEKLSVLDSIFAKQNYSNIFKNFVKYLVAEKRMGIFPMIFKEMVVIDDHNKGFLRGTVEGNDDQADIEFLNKVKSYLKKKLGKEPQLTYVKNNKITAGYRVTVEDLQLDTTLDNQLERFKIEVLNS